MTNRIPVQQELIAAAKKDDEFWRYFSKQLSWEQRFEGDKKGNVHFPFITTCLLIGASFELNTGFYGNVKVQSFYRMPLSARTYLEAYHSKDEANRFRILQSFEGRPLVTTGTLRETWPHGAWNDQSPSSDAYAGFHPDSTGPLDFGSLDLVDKPKSLRDQAMDRLLDLLLDSSEEDASILVAETSHLPDFVSKLRQRLYNQASVLEPSATTTGLLAKALGGVANVDLSRFTLWRAEHLSTLVTQLQKVSDRRKVLNMSNMPDLTEYELEMILNEHESASPFIKAVIILEGPKISLDFVTKRLGNRDVYHSELFRRSLYDPRWSGDTFHDNRSRMLPALQFEAPNSISQFVWVGISSTASCDAKNRLDDDQFDWSSMKFTNHIRTLDIHEGQSFKKDIDRVIYTNFLLDIPLPVGKTVQSMWRLLQFMTSGPPFYDDVAFNAMARCFATTSSLDDCDYSVGPLSQTLTEARNYSSKVIHSGKHHYLQPGHWAIVVVQEGFDTYDQEDLNKQATETFGVSNKAEDAVPSFKPTRRSRYMLAQAISSTEFSGPRYMITGLQGYIKHALEEDPPRIEKLEGWWAKRSSRLPKSTGYYDQEDGHTILDHVYSKERFDDEVKRSCRSIDISMCRTDMSTSCITTAGLCYARLPPCSSMSCHYDLALTDLHTNMSGPTTLDAQPKGNNTAGMFERKGVFRFMSLPQELHQTIYELALISDCIQPGLADSFQRSRYPEMLVDYESIPAVTLLCTCKQIYHEANVVLYSHNTFTTFYRPTWQQTENLLQDLAEEKGVALQDWTTDWAARQWKACHDVVTQAVSTVHEPDASKLPVWLFGDFAPGAVPKYKYHDWDPWALKPSLGYDHPCGFYITGFLRKIGPSNAAKIQRLELTLGSLPNAADFLPLFTHILTQHVKGLRKLVIGRLNALPSLYDYFDCINDYGSEMEFDERNEYQAAHAIAFFTELRTLVKHLPHLQQIDTFGCADEMGKMANAVLEEKRTGVEVDLEKKWATLFEEAKTRLLAIPAIANASCAGYRVEEYIYLPNWQKNYRNA
ncbi:MAG: hypothetical protein Q9226_007067 [Calogaya cf. arnoldii]